MILPSIRPPCFFYLRPLYHCVAHTAQINTVSACTWGIKYEHIGYCKGVTAGYTIPEPRSACSFIPSPPPALFSPSIKLSPCPFVLTVFFYSSQTLPPLLIISTSFHLRPSPASVLPPPPHHKQGVMRRGEEVKRLRMHLQLRSSPVCLPPPLDQLVMRV